MMTQILKQKKFHEPREKQESCFLATCHKQSVTSSPLSLKQRVPHLKQAKNQVDQVLTHLQKPAKIYGGLAEKDRGKTNKELCSLLHESFSLSFSRSLHSLST